VKEARQKGPHIVGLHFYEMPRIGKFIEMESRLTVARARVGEMESDGRVGIGFLFGIMKIFSNYLY